MQIADSVQERLVILRIIDHFQSRIFRRQLGERLGNLVNIRLILCMIAHSGIGFGNIAWCIGHRAGLGGKGIASVGVQLLQCPEIACMQLRNFRRFIALQQIELADPHLLLLVGVIHGVICFQNAGSHLNK